MNVASRITSIFQVALSLVCVSILLIAAGSRWVRGGRRVLRVLMLALLLRMWADIFWLIRLFTVSTKTPLSQSPVYTVAISVNRFIDLGSIILMMAGIILLLRTLGPATPSRHPRI